MELLGAAQDINDSSRGKKGFLGQVMMEKIKNGLGLVMVGDTFTLLFTRFFSYLMPG